MEHFIQEHFGNYKNYRRLPHWSQVHKIKGFCYLIPNMVNDKLLFINL